MSGLPGPIEMINLQEMCTTNFGIFSIADFAPIFQVFFLCDQLLVLNCLNDKATREVYTIDKVIYYLFIVGTVLHNSFHYYFRLIELGQLSTTIFQNPNRIIGTMCVSLAEVQTSVYTRHSHWPYSSGNRLNVFLFDNNCIQFYLCLFSIERYHSINKFVALAQFFFLLMHNIVSTTTAGSKTDSPAYGIENNKKNRRKNATR